MPKILRIINRFNLGGPTYNAAYLSKYLGSDYQTLLVGGAKDESEESSTHILDALDLEYHIIPELRREINPKNDRAAYRKIVKLIKEFRPDIVHTHASKAGAVGRLAAAKMNVPVIVHTFHGHVFHSYFSKPKTFLYKSVEQYLARKSTKIIAISAKQKHELAVEHNIAPEDKFAVIPLGFDLSRFAENQAQKRQTFRAEYQLTEHQIAVGIIGRLVPVKNHGLFLQMVARLQKQFPQAVFFIIGDGEEKENLLRQAQNLSLNYGLHNEANAQTHRLIFTSWIKNVDWALAGLDLITLTSLNEGTPVSLIEAQAAAKPIVSTDVGGISDIITAKHPALLSAVDNPTQFIDNVAQMLQTIHAKSISAEEGRAEIFRKFHYTRLVNDMENLYNSLLKNKTHEKNKN